MYLEREVRLVFEFFGDLHPVSCRALWYTGLFRTFGKLCRMFALVRAVAEASSAQFRQLLEAIDPRYGPELSADEVEG